MFGVVQWISNVLLLGGSLYTLTMLTKYRREQKISYLTEEEATELETRQMRKTLEKEIRSEAYDDLMNEYGDVIQKKEEQLQELENTSFRSPKKK